MAFHAFQDKDRGEPDFVNASGVEFRLEKSLTRYAREKLGEDWVVWYTSGQGVQPSYLLAEKDEPVADDSMYEGIATRVDIIAYMRESDGYGKKDMGYGGESDSVGLQSDVVGDERQSGD